MCAVRELRNISTLGYIYFRRFLSSHNLEAVCALLEDGLQFRRIKQASSRHKWARAIVASVEGLQYTHNQARHRRRGARPCEFACVQS